MMPQALLPLGAILGAGAAQQAKPSFMTGLTGLLGGQDPLFNIGMGLLSANQKSLTPQNPFEHIMRFQQMGADTRAQQLQMQAMIEKMAEEKRLREEMAKRQAAIERMSQSMPPELREMAALYPDEVARHQVENALARQNVKPTATIEQINGPNGPILAVVTRGQDGKALDIKALGGSSGVTVNVGEAGKPLGSDATKWSNEKGKAPDPRMSLTEATEAGFKPLTPAELKVRDDEAQQAEMFRILDTEIARTEQEYTAAQKAFSDNPTLTTRRELDNAANALKTAKAARANWRGEPGADVARRFDVPGAFGSLLEGLNTPNQAQQAQDPYVVPQSLRNKYPGVFK